MMKKYVEWVNGFYGTKDLFSSDSEIRTKAWKATGKATLISAVVIGVCGVIDFVAEKFVEKKVNDFRDKLEKENPDQPTLSRVADTLNYENEVCGSMRTITAIVGFVIGITGSVVAIRHLKKD